jgi:hypothetical protein
MATETKQRLKDIYHRLMALNNTESSLSQLEGLFYEALSISREEGDDDMLVKLKKVESSEYQQVLLRPQTKAKKEAAIKTFRHAFKNILTEKNTAHL